jgi:ParB/RepB/Spo0J family partition protein
VLKSSPRKIESIAIADIQVGVRRRELDPAALRVIIKSISLIGLQMPITVRRDEKLRAEVSPTAVALVLGYYRFEAAKALGWEFIDAFVIDGDEIDARIRQLIENLCRAELTALERAEAVTELVDLVRQRDEPGQLAHPRGRQPHDRGISQASRTLGFTREEVRRSKAIAGISPEAKAKAKEHGLDKNQSALLEIANENTADGQLAKIDEIAILSIGTRARLRKRRGDTQAKLHKKSKAISRQAEPKSCGSEEPVESVALPVATSPATVPETGSEGNVASEIELLKAQLAEKTERLRQLENELRQARLAASRVTSPPSMPMHGDDDLVIPPYLDRRPLSTEEDETLAALVAMWDRDLKERLAAATAIIRERFFTIVWRAAEDAHDGSVNTTI